MNVSLVGFGSSGVKREYHVKPPRFVIGRKPENDLSIPHAAVSRQHCEIVIEQGHAKVRDLGSSNGTFLNDVRVQEANLAPGDRLAVGPVVLTVQINGQPASIGPPNAIPDGRSNDPGASGTSAAGIPAARLDDSDIPAPDPRTRKAEDAEADAPSEGDALSRMIKKSQKDESSVFDFDFDDDDDD